MRTSDAFVAGLVIPALTALAAVARAQDVQGIEICTAEKTMERRTGCLQSNVNFLQQSLTRQALAAQQKLDATNAEMRVLKEAVSTLQKEVERLNLAAQQKDGAKTEARSGPEKAPATETVTEPAKK